MSRYSEDKDIMGLYQGCRGINKTEGPSQVEGSVSGVVDRQYCSRPISEKSGNLACHVMQDGQLTRQLRYVYEKREEII